MTGSDVGIIAVAIPALGIAVWATGMLFVGRVVRARRESGRITYRANTQPSSDHSSSLTM